MGFDNIFLVALLIDSLSLFTDGHLPLERDAASPSATRVPAMRPAKRPAMRPAVKQVEARDMNTVEAPKKRRWCRSSAAAATIVIGGVQLRIEVGEVEPRNIKVEPK